jgi:Fic-DOC domain mobile mystery protein B
VDVIRHDDLPEGATPLQPDEVEGLIPFVTTRAQLNALEQASIRQAEDWLLFSKRRLRTFQVDRTHLVQLHQRMFGELWTWAGAFRQTERNIGVDPTRISVEVRNLCDDFRFWIDSATYPLDEAAARLHHRLVAIHPFPNGNGRHARLVADAVLLKGGAQRFTWGRGDLLGTGEVRRRYLAALRAADRYDLEPLLAFVRA